jgi:hypothetical protein
MSLTFTLPKRVLSSDDFYGFCVNNIPNTQITSPFDKMKIELKNFNIVLRIKLKTDTFEFFSDVKIIEIKSNHSGLYGSYDPIISIYTQDNVIYIYNDFSKKWSGNENLNIDYDICCEIQEIQDTKYDIYSETQKIQDTKYDIYSETQKETV